MGKVKTKTALLNLGYFKQGDDLAECLAAHDNNIVLALREHATMMDDAANNLRHIANIISKSNCPGEVEVDCSGHDIEITAPGEVIDLMFGLMVVNVEEGVRCQNCVWEGDEADCDPIVDLHQRVAAGEPMPAGQCPECGALCQLKEPA